MAWGGRRTGDQRRGDGCCWSAPGVGRRGRVLCVWERESWPCWWACGGLDVGSEGKGVEDDRLSEVSREDSWPFLRWGSPPEEYVWG